MDKKYLKKEATTPNIEKSFFVGKRRARKSVVNLINYSKTKLEETEISEIREGVKKRTANSTTWINIVGLKNEDLIEEVGKTLDLHSLLIEDIAVTGQRAKLTENEDNIFIVLKMLDYNEEKGIVDTEQLSMVIADKFLITFQESRGDVFEPVRERIRSGQGRLRGNGADYLAYALLDTVVDNYIDAIEKIGEQVEDLEDYIIGFDGPEIVDRIKLYKREMNYLRRAIRPAKEAIMKLSRLESSIIDEKTKPYIKDLEDLVSQAAESIDTYRDMLSDQLNVYHANLSNRLNEVMKVLTIFTAFFIPLTFIAGVYGMNFKHFPELSYKYSYLVFWLVITTITVFMIRFFKRKKWF